MRFLTTIFALLLALGFSCGPEEPGPTPTVFVDASVVPTQERSLSVCESACRRLQELDCPRASTPRGDCRGACRKLDVIAEMNAEPACIVGARSCDDVESCQGR